MRLLCEQVITTSFTSILHQAVVMLNMQCSIIGRLNLLLKKRMGKPLLNFDIRLLLNAILVSIRSFAS